MRDLRCSIRLEARSGALSSRLFGTPGPTRRLARLADEVLTRAETVASRIFLPAEGSLTERLDRIAVGLRDGRAGERTGDIYAVCRAILDAEGVPGTIVSELRIAVHPGSRRTGAVADPMAAAVRAAHRMAASGIVRRCLSTTLLPRDAEIDADLDTRIALTLWLAVLVRAASREEGGLVLEGARLAVEAEGVKWGRLLREGRLEALSEAWRRTVPYLP